jgi:hypothetical protein
MFSAGGRYIVLEQIIAKLSFKSKYRGFYENME